MAASLVGQLALGVKADLDRFRSDLQSQAPRIGDEVGTTLGARIKARLSAANIGTAIGATLGGLGVGALRLADRYDDAMDTIRIGTGATGEALRGLEADFAAVAGRVPADIGLVGQVVADLNTRTGQTGQGLQDLATQFLELSRLSKTDAATNVALLTRLYGDWSIATDKQATANDQLFRTAQATGIGVDALAERVVQFGAPMRALGLSFETSIALLGKWEKEGVNIETVLSGMRMAVANFAKAGVDPREGLPALIAEIGTLDDAQGLLAAKQIVGQRAANDFFRAVKEGRFDVAELLGVVEDGADTIEQAARDTDGFGEAFRRLQNQVAVAAGPIVRDLAGIGSELGNVVFLLPALGGALGRGLGALWTKAGGGAAVRAAITAAGAAAGAVYQAAAFAGRTLIAAAQAAWNALGGSQALGSVRSLGGLAGGTFGTAFKVAAVAGVALLWVEVWNQFTAFQAKVAEAQADLQQKVDAATQQTGSEAIANLRNLTTTMRELQGADRILADTFGGAQQVEGLRNLAVAIKNDASLTAGEIEDALALLADASQEALARGNAAIAGELDDVAATLRARGPVVAQAAQAAYDPLSSVRPPALPAVEPPAVAKPIRREFADARKAIAQGFGSVKAALADPPALIGREDRLANMEARFRKVMRNLRKAVEADDPFAVDYWTKAAAKQQLQIERMKTRTTSSVEDVRESFTKAGVKIDGTWLDIAKGAGRTKRKVDQVGDAVEAIPDTTTTTIEADTAGATTAVERLATSIRSITSGEYAVRIGGQVYGGVGGRQHGGRVERGRPYLVGEVRPELFVPDMAGRIEPRPSVVRPTGGGGSGGTSIDLQLHGLPMRASTPSEVVSQLRRAARLGVLEPRRRAAWNP